MEPITINKSVKLDMTLLGQRCHLQISTQDTINLHTGESIENTSIDTIIGEDGQTIHPRMLTPNEFRYICRQSRIDHTL